MRWTLCWISVGLSVVAGCANAHEGDGDAGSVVFPDVGASLVVDMGTTTPCGPTVCAVGLACCNASCGICTEPGVGCVDLACADAGAAPRRCGGFAGPTCSPSEYCDYPAGSSCARDDAEGVCVPRPTECPDPGGELVCGCDDHDYVGECAAHLAGTDVSRTGRCHPTTPATRNISAERSCGPTDGPAWTFTVTNGTEASCGPSAVAALRVTLWGDLASVAADHTFHVNMDGFATSCPAGVGTPCIGFTGTVTLHSFLADEGAVISYDLMATTGERVTADHLSITAWCPTAPLCG